MNSARDQEHYVTRRIPRTPTFCRLRPENAKCRSTSTRVCAGVSKRKATLKITATKRRGLVATRNCERSQRANYGQGPQMSALLTGRTLKKQKARRKEHSHWKSEKQLHHGGGGAAAEGHTLRAKGKLAATSRDWKTVLTNSHSKAHGCQGSGSTLGLSRKQTGA